MCRSRQAARLRRNKGFFVDEMENKNFGPRFDYVITYGSYVQEISNGQYEVFDRHDQKTHLITFPSRADYQHTLYNDDDDPAMLDYAMAFVPGHMRLVVTDHRYVIRTARGRLVREIIKPIVTRL
jgi:hypothetical protein